MELAIVIKIAQGRRVVMGLPEPGLVTFLLLLHLIREIHDIYKHAFSS
jgi:hypothetical protein